MASNQKVMMNQKQKEDFYLYFTVAVVVIGVVVGLVLVNKQK